VNTIEVALPLPLDPLSYLPPQGEAPRLGARVVVPFRRGLRVGLVVGVGTTRTPHALKTAIGYLDEEPFLPEPGVARLHRAAAFLFVPAGQVVADFLPFIEAPFTHRVRLVKGAPRPPGWPDEGQGWLPAKELPAELLEELRAGGVLEEAVAEAVPEVQILRPRRRPDTGLSPQARAALETLWALGEAESQADLARRAGVGAAAVRTLIKKGYAEVVRAPRELSPPPLPIRPLSPLYPPFIPDRVHGGRFTERMAVLKGLMEAGPHLVLFPEGALLNRAAVYFPEAVRFSGSFPAALRRRLWRVRKKSVLGSFQALFFPEDFERVVVVEEESDAHKLPAGSRAFLPELARALFPDLLYLGAAPTARALFFAKNPLRLKPRRVRGRVLDKTRHKGFFAGETQALMRQALDKGRQVLVMAARKGYAARLVCGQCGFEPSCPNCALPLRYHKDGKGGRLVCHQCGHTEPAPPRCPACGSELLLARGPGLDWIADDLAARFPGVPVGRLFSGGAHDLKPLAAGEPGILVATTRVLRQNPLVNLALVVFPWVEGFLPESDFRAAEGLFSLLWQLADLDERKNPYFLLQAYNPRHPAIEGFLAGTLEDFPRSELALRQALGYPPVVRMVKVEVSHRQEGVAAEAAHRLAERMQARARPEEILGPAPAPVPRVRGRYVWHLLLKSADEARLAELVAALGPAAPARLRLDPDPIGFGGLLE